MEVIKIKIRTKLTMEDVVGLIESFKKIPPPDIYGIYSEMTINQKSNEGGTFDTDDCIVKLTIVGETFREYYDLSSGIEPWYECLKPELEDYSEKDTVSYKKINEFLESLVVSGSGLQRYSITNEPRIRFSDFRGAYIHNVITIEFGFGSNIESVSLPILYPKIGELK